MLHHTNSAIRFYWLFVHFYFVYTQSVNEIIGITKTKTTNEIKFNTHDNHSQWWYVKTVRRRDNTNIYVQMHKSKHTSTLKWSDTRRKTMALRRKQVVHKCYKVHNNNNNRSNSNIICCLTMGRERCTQQYGMYGESLTLCTTIIYSYIVLYNVNAAQQIPLL